MKAVEKLAHTREDGKLRTKERENPHAYRSEPTTPYNRSLLQKKKRGLMRKRWRGEYLIERGDYHKCLYRTKPLFIITYNNNSHESTHTNVSTIHHKHKNKVNKTRRRAKKRYYRIVCMYLHSVNRGVQENQELQERSCSQQ